MSQNVLRNPSFEGKDGKGNWVRATHTGVEYGEIYTPEGWVTWFREGGEFRRPECKVIPKAAPFLDPPRVHDGNWAWMAFTMFGRQHAGLYQIVEGLEPGAEYELSAYAHAWSAHHGELAVDNSGCSAGVGCGPVYIPEDEVPELNGEPENDAIGNFTFRVGVGFGDPDPFSDAIKWGDGACIYNVHHQAPPLRFVAPDSGKVVVYLKAFSLWPFRTSDAYWDDVQLIRVGDKPQKPEKPEPSKERGSPREQYERTYVLLPPSAGAAWALAAVDGGWDEFRYTIGSSADDAGIGDLESRRVIAVNPGLWPGDLRAFFAEHYPGVEYVPIEAEKPRDLKRALERLL